MNYIFLILGSIVLFSLRLNEAWVKPQFKWSYFIKRNVIPAFVIIVFGFAIIYGKVESENLMNKILPSLNFKISPITMFLLGITGDVILKKIIGLFDKETITKIGLNKK
jgi:H+/gluconate symporter-like permease